MEEQKKTEETVTMSKTSIYLGVIGVLALLLVISIFTQGFGIVKPAATGTGGAAASSVQNPSGSGSGTDTGTGGTGAASLRTMAIPSTLADASKIGQGTSGITLLEFSDFQCPFCGMAWGKEYSAQYAQITGTVPKFEADYVQQGKADFIMVPVAFLGQESTDAANAALCAEDQGKFFEMHDAIFNAQDTSENNGKYAPDKLKAMAAGIAGIDTAKFNSCVDSGTHVGQVQSETSEWQTVSYTNTGNAGTPTFYILVDASKVSKDKVSQAASLGGYEAGITSDGKTYVILADPAYAQIQNVMDALVA